MTLVSPSDIRLAEYDRWKGVPPKRDVEWAELIHDIISGISASLIK